MLMRNRLTPIVLLAWTTVGLSARTAQAGPLLDWLFHRPAAGPAIPVGPPYQVSANGYAPYAAALPYAANSLPYTAGYVPNSTGYAPYSSGYSPYGVAYPLTGAPRYSTGYAPASSYTLPNYGAGYSAGYGAATVAPNTSAYGTYYGAQAPVVGANGYGYMAQRPNNDMIASAQAVMPSNAPVTLVPDYRSTATRTPVTYYRPVLTTDPNTGAQVVTLAPCSSYEYQTQRVPTWGLTQVFNGGATLPATSMTLPPTSPTYSLPRGGVPLAGPVPGTQPYGTAYGSYPAPATSMVVPVAPSRSSIITPAMPTAPYSSGYSGYASNYGNYSALQPPASVPPSSTYPTSPYGGTGASPYYGPGTGTSGAGSTGGGSTGGGSTGGYAAPTTSNPYATGPYSAGPYAPPPSSLSNPALSNPGLPAPAPTVPAYPPGSQVLPPSSVPGQVLPPSSDPAAGAVPGLPPMPTGMRSDAKPQLQNVVQQPMPGNRTFQASPSTQAPVDTKVKREPVAPGLLPIPVPDDFKHEPRWNPGLLKEQDTTASISKPMTSAPAIQPTLDPSIAWGSKPIRWASLKQRSTSEPTVPEPSLEMNLPASKLRDKQPRLLKPEVVDDIPLVNFPAVEVEMVPLKTAQPQALELTPAIVPPPAPQPAPKSSTQQGRYRHDVWQAVK